MLWEVELRPLGRDAERERVCDEFDLLTQSQRGIDLVSSSARGFLLEGPAHAQEIAQLVNELLCDPLVESPLIRRIGEGIPQLAYTVLLKPGVMDPVSESVKKAAADIGVSLEEVRTFRRYFANSPAAAADQELLFRKILANDAVEQVISTAVKADHLSLGKPYRFQKVVVPLLQLSDAELVTLSKSGQLALTLEEMQTIQAHYRQVQRDPTDIELESIAQTWSEHCSHKTLKGKIEYSETVAGHTRTTLFQNMLKETIFAATQTLRKQWGHDDWCVSVFADNAGVVKFHEQFHICFKVETHNRPSAIEPYGGANTGLGGVIRDVLGTGLGGKPICNTDIFCFAPPDYPVDQLPAGVLHPRRVIHGVVAGVRDYGNRMGIPTVNGAVYFDERYLANPLVFCGTVGLIPVGMEHKEVHPGDLIVAVGGRTGRDGIHGATFSSLELTDQSEKVSGGAVQIGNAITEKKVQDVVLQARDRRLYRSITDCGAGGFSSAVGEMAADLGAIVHLQNAPLKYDGLSYTEIWISESQERMVLAVAPEKWEELRLLCESEDVEAAVLGTFEQTGRLKLYYKEDLVGDLDMHFLHDGRPPLVRQATWQANPPVEVSLAVQPNPQETLLKILSNYSVCSKEWIIRQYDHEVQAGSVIKPLTGVQDDGPSDAAVVRPILNSDLGAAIGCGLNPRYADYDPWNSAACAIDEAVRNVVAVGADPSRIAILDNFCWGNVHDSSMLGALVRTSLACQSVALAYGTPFISGKDSLNNEYKSPTRRISIPHTLLISALGQVSDVRKCVTMDLKEPGNELWIVGQTSSELGGSIYQLVTGQSGGSAPSPNLSLAPKIFQAMHRIISSGLIRACHDLSDGGLAVAAAEMAFAGGIGLDLSEFQQFPAVGTLEDHVRLFSESPTRFLIEVPPQHVQQVRELLTDLPAAKLGITMKEPRLRIAGSNGEWLIWAKLSELKEAWQKPLRW
jgi:phosphoribosylformylglycinamidine synthase subunit PurSL